MENLQIIYFWKGVEIVHYNDNSVQAYVQINIANVSYLHIIYLHERKDIQCTTQDSMREKWRGKKDNIYGAQQTEASCWIHNNPTNRLRDKYIIKFNEQS